MVKVKGNVEKLLLSFSGWNFYDLQERKYWNPGI